jgi:hypothetical protein
VPLRNHLLGDGLEEEKPSPQSSFRECCIAHKDRCRRGHGRVSGSGHLDLGPVSGIGRSDRDMIACSQLHTDRLDSWRTQKGWGLRAKEVVEVDNPGAYMSLDLRLEVNDVAGTRLPG